MVQVHRDGGEAVGLHRPAAVGVEVAYAKRRKRRRLGRCRCLLDRDDIAAGKDEVAIPVKVDDSANAGQLQNVAVQATAMVEGKVPIAHEAKINFTVEKAMKK